MITNIITFPLEPLGSGLRSLSLSGSAGNGAAILLYAIIGLLPVFGWLLLKKKKLLLKADYLLFPVSAVVFYTLYYSVNPGLFETQMEGTGGIYLAGLFYSALITYAVVRIQNMASLGGKKTIQKLLKAFLIILGCIFFGIIALEFAISMPAALEEVEKAYESLAVFISFAGGEVTANLMVMRFLTVTGVILEVIPYILDLIILREAYRLIGELDQDWYSEGSVKTAARLAAITGRNLVIVAVLGFVYNLLQMMSRNMVLNSEMKVHIPVISILFLLSVLLLAKYISAAQKLHQENELFV